jgi:hypothetical protein
MNPANTYFTSQTLYHPVTFVDFGQEQEDTDLFPSMDADTSFDFMPLDDEDMEQDDYEGDSRFQPSDPFAIRDSNMEDGDDETDGDAFAVVWDT